MRKLLFAALAVAAVAVVVTVAAQPKEPEKKPEDKRFEVRITDEMIRHSRIRDILYFVSNGWSLAVLALLLVSGASKKMRDAAARATKRPFVASMIYIAMLIIAVTILELPLTYYSGFVVPHQFDLSDQSFGSWLADGVKGLIVGLVIGTILGALALLGIRKTRRWWLALWVASIPVILFFAVIQPIVLDPIFNRFEPLQDVALRQKLLDLASRAGIEGSRVYQVDKSKQTKTMNAYVNGIGPTNRIVMWDTLLAKMTHDEVVAVMGHEMGHYAMKHMWAGLAFGLAVSFAVLFLVQRIHDATLPRVGPKWGFTERGDPASLPWLFLIASVIGFLVTPIGAAYSRSIEHKADMFALELTHLNEPLATAFVKMAEDSKRDPSPHPFIEFWRYSHPPIAKRIPFALSYRPWEKGEPNRVWKP
jgi:Zn-dependent protease with chaperone function